MRAVRTAAGVTRRTRLLSWVARRKVIDGRRMVTPYGVGVDSVACRQARRDSSTRRMTTDRPASWGLLWGAVRIRPLAIALSSRSAYFTAKATLAASAPWR